MRASPEGLTARAIEKYLFPFFLFLMSFPLSQISTFLYLAYFI